MVHYSYHNFSYNFICFSISIYRMTYSTLIPFSSINNISISLINSNFSPVFFKQACHTNPGADKK